VVRGGSARPAEGGFVNEGPNGPEGLQQPPTAGIPPPPPPPPAPGASAPVAPSETPSAGGRGRGKLIAVLVAAGVVVGGVAFAAITGLHKVAGTSDLLA